MPVFFSSMCFSPIEMSSLQMLTSLDLSNGGFTGCDWNSEVFLPIPSNLTTLDVSSALNAFSSSIRMHAHSLIPCLYILCCQISNNAWLPLILRPEEHLVTLTARNANVRKFLKPLRPMVPPLEQLFLDDNSLGLDPMVRQNETLRADRKVDEKTSAVY